MLSLFMAMSDAKATAATALRRFRSDESGVTAIEYGLIAGAIAVVIIGTVIILGPQLNNIFNTVKTSLNTIPGNAN